MKIKKKRIKDLAFVLVVLVFVLFNLICMKMTGQEVRSVAPWVLYMFCGCLSIAAMIYNNDRK